MTSYRIPFNKPALMGDEIRYLEDAVASGHISGGGPYGRRCEALLEETLGVRRALLTTSGTHALEMAALLLDLAPGDEVIVPAFTFVSTVNAFVLRGAVPVFVDIRRDTLNLDESQLAARLTTRTRAIVPVHYGGVACAMDDIDALARARDITVVEDNAHGLFGRYQDRPLGSLGRMAALSFHETKNVSCGEGGALLLNDAALVERAEVIREKGTDRSRFFRGMVDKYTWVDVGSSYVLSDLLAAFLCAQLEARAEILARRQRVWETYATRLGPWAAQHGLQLPTIPAGCAPSYHLFYLLLRSPAQRARLMAHLRAAGILAVFHYLPLHLSVMGRRFGGRPGDCPVTEDVSDRLLRLPFYNDLTPVEQETVVAALLAFDAT